MSKLLSATLLLLAAGPLAATPLAPVGEKEDALLEDEIRFAEDLARYRFYNLAIGHLREIKGQKLSGDLEGTAVLTEARIYKSSSMVEADEDKRLEHQSTAISLLHDWKQAGSPYAFHDRRVDALKDLAELLRERANTYKRRSQDPANPSADTSKALADQDYDDADETYEMLRREAEARAEQLIDLEQEDEAEPFLQTASNTYLWKGINNIEWSAVSKDADFKLENAVEELENYQWDLPDEGMLQSYVAMQYQARAMFLLGDADDALDLWDQVIEEMTGGFLEIMSDFDPYARASIMGVLSRTYGMKAEAQLKSGDLAGGEASIAELVALHDGKSQPLGRDGHQVVLDWHVALDGVGQGARALDLLKRIAAEGQGTREGTIAGAYLSSAIEGGEPGESLNVAPDVLMSVAESKKREGKNRDAAFTYQQVIAKRAEGDDPTDLAIRAWEGLSTVLRRDGRHLEAALAFEQTMVFIEEAGLETDQAYAESWRTAVSNYQRSMENRYKVTRDDFDRDLRDTARAAAQERGIGSADTAFDAAKEVFEEAQGLARALRDDSSDADRTAVAEAFRDAGSEFISIEENASVYESALVYRARAAAGAGDHDEALGLFDEMIARADGPRPTDPSARSRREQATAEAYYYKALLLVERERPADALAALEGFEDRVPGQESFHEQAKYQRVIASALLGDLPATEAAVTDLESVFPDSGYIANAAFRLATTLDDAATAAADAGNAARSTELRAQAATAMFRHCELAGFPSFTNLMRAASWFVQSGEGTDAEEAYQTAVDRFAGKLDDRRVDEARIGLGTALNTQQDFGKARAVWQELLARESRRPSIVQGAARCFGGWLEEDANGAIVEIAGSGDYMEAFELWKQLKKGFDVDSKYTESWWEAKLGTIWTLYRAGTSDSQRFFDARKVIENQKLTTPGYDEDTRANLEPDQLYTRSFKPLFRYLDKTIPNG